MIASACRRTALAIYIAVSCALSFGAQTDYYATSVPAVNNWEQESLARGAPPNEDCDNSDYAYADSGNNYLEALSFQSISIPAGQAVDRVRAQVFARYNTGTSATIRLRARWTGTSSGVNSPYGELKTLNSSGTNCRWSSLDITNLEDFWNNAELNSIDILVKRQNGTSTNTRLRAKAFRIRVDYAPDCNGNMIPDYRDIAAGAPDCDGDGIPDSCELSGNDCNNNDVPDSCEFSGVVANDDYVMLDFGGAVPINVVANDVNWNPSLMRVAIVDYPIYGTLATSSTPGVLTFISSNQPGECGNVLFRYRLQGLGSCSGWTSNTTQGIIAIRGASNDCNENCIDDALDLSTGTSQDCNGNGRPDECDTANVNLREDSDSVGFAQSIEIDVLQNDTGFESSWMEVVVVRQPTQGSVAAGSSYRDLTYTAPSQLGACEFTATFEYEFRGTGACSAYRSDPVEVEVYIFGDSNDCNDNCRDDDLDILLGSSADCGQNGVPDECEDPELRATDDDVTVQFGQITTLDLLSNDPDGSPQTSRPIIIDEPQFGFAQFDAISGLLSFTSSNVSGDCGADQMSYRLVGVGACAGIESRIIDVDIDVEPAEDDCNGNCVDDATDIANGLLRDCDGDGIPSMCDSFEDCNNNGISDCDEIDQGTVEDLDLNGVPDDCQEFTRNFCQPMTNSIGCQSVMKFRGVAALQSSTLQVFTDNVIPNTFGLLVWSLEEASIPLGGGTLCLAPPYVRTSVRAAVAGPGAPPCDGLLIYSWTTDRLSAAMLAPGDWVFCQFWSRDGGALGGLNLTDGAAFQVLP